MCWSPCSNSLTHGETTGNAHSANILYSPSTSYQVRDLKMTICNTFRNQFAFPLSIPFEVRVDFKHKVVPIEWLVQFLPEHNHAQIDFFSSIRKPWNTCSMLNTTKLDVIITLTLSVGGITTSHMPIILNNPSNLLNGCTTLRNTFHKNTTWTQVTQQKSCIAKNKKLAMSFLTHIHKEWLN